MALNRWRLLPNYQLKPHITDVQIPQSSRDISEIIKPDTKPDIKPDKHKSSLASISKYLSTISLFDRSSSFEQEVRTTAKSDCNRGIGDYITKEPVRHNSIRQIQCWAECASLQSIQLEPDESYGHMVGLEKNLCFDNFNQKAKAIEMSNWTDHLLKAEMETDGLIATNHPYNTQWYSTGRKWSIGW